jgi:hypothetical protein
MAPACVSAAPSAAVVATVQPSTSLAPDTSAAPRRRRCAWGVALLAVWFGLLPARAGAAHAGTAQPAPEATPLIARLAALETGFRDNRADVVLRSFARDRQVVVQTARGRPLVRLGPGPLEALVKQWFATRRTIRFEVGDVPLAPGQSRVFVTATWTYRDSASSTLQVDQLYLVLFRAAEHPEWLIVEMKTSHR